MGSKKPIKLILSALIINNHFFYAKLTLDYCTTIAIVAVLNQQEYDNSQSRSVH